MSTTGVDGGNVERSSVSAGSPAIPRLVALTRSPASRRAASTSSHEWIVILVFGTARSFATTSARASVRLTIRISVTSTSTPVVDIVYVPLETDLLATARRRGHPVVDGLGMLLHQGRPGFEAWFGTPVQVTHGLRAVIVATLAPAR